jgi:hypothetical protein
MVGHLDHVEQRMLARMPRKQDVDVVAILRAAIARDPAPPRLVARPARRRPAHRPP